MSETEKAKYLTEQTARKWLDERGVKTTEIAELVYFLQKDYHADLKLTIACIMLNELYPKEKYKMPF